MPCDRPGYPGYLAFLLSLNSMLILVSWFAACLVGLCGLYLWLLALASVAGPRRISTPRRERRFAIAIPAHDEEDVIGASVATMQRLDYPRDKYDIYVVADFCNDRTAEVARASGAKCFERQEGDRGAKGAVLRWLFPKIFAESNKYDAVVIWDADTQVEASFLRAINARLEAGAQVIQGRHVISNPRSGWFPALAWAMMTIDNRFNNLGRDRLGLSAKHMGDSICFKSEVLKSMGWGSGLTEDYEFRLRLLEMGIGIEYEPGAIGYGQAPLTWKEAQAQRLRWARGTLEAGRKHGRTLFLQGLREDDWRKLDGAISSWLPSYSALAILSAGMAALHVALVGGGAALTWVWAALTVSWFFYPLFGLALEKAPGWAYLAILSGPVFMVWRIGLGLKARFRGKQISWVRTQHQAELPEK